MNTGKTYDIAVLGAGAAGLAAAIAAGEADGALQIAILEKNEKAGKKLYATGNGRCNLLNRRAVPGDFRSAEGAAAAFAAPVLNACGPAELQRVFAELGLDTVEEGEGRLYPRSLQAASVVRALERGARKADLICGFEARDVRRDEAGLFRIFAQDGRQAAAKRLILTTGGKAGIQYGCDGRGLKIAESLGHRIVKPIPALTGFVCAEKELLEKLAGVRVRGTVKLIRGSGPVLSEDTGEIQFNKDSISGICVMNVSGYYRRSGEEPFVLVLDLMPEIDAPALAAKLAARKETLGDYFLDALLPARLAEALPALSGAEGQTPEALAALIKSLRFTPEASKGWKDAHTTSGGVSLDEVDPGTMESRVVPGLFFAGEILDIDGPCGGYSLTWAFGSGRMAGSSAARR